MHITIWQHVGLSWLAVAWLVIFAIKYGIGGRDDNDPDFNRGLLVRYLLAVGLTNWPLLADSVWRFLAIAPILITIVGLTMIEYGTTHEQRDKEARFPIGAEIVGNGGGVAIVGLVASLVILNIAALNA